MFINIVHHIENILKHCEERAYSLRYVECVELLKESEVIQTSIDG